MNKSIKKSLSLFLALVIASSMLCAETIVFGENLIAINETNFSDPVFRDVLSEYYDTEPGTPGFLSESERSQYDGVMALSGRVKGRKIKSLDGIEFFADYLTNLYCGGIGIEEFDPSSLVNLTELTCEGNELISLDVSALKNLVSLNCSGNELETIVLGNLPSLVKVHCYANFLTEIDTSGLANLTDFRCDQNQLDSLDVSNNTKLTAFNCSDNCISKLDLSSNASLGTVTDYMIGEQIISEKASAYLSTIYVDFAKYNLNPEKLVKCSLEDYGDGSGFDGEKFVSFDVSQMDNGFDYYYDVNLPGSEYMQVTVEVQRDFYQVNFYNDSDMTQLITKSFTDESGTVMVPNVTDIPQCKAFDKWSSDVSHVTSDMNVYSILKDAHSYALTAFDGDIATVTCSTCGNHFTLSFKAAINAESGDSNYSPYLDVVSDGYINAKDYAKLTKMF